MFTFAPCICGFLSGKPSSQPQIGLRNRLATSSRIKR